MCTAARTPPSPAPDLASTLLDAAPLALVLPLILMIGVQAVVYAAAWRAGRPVNLAGRIIGPIAGVGAALALGGAFVAAPDFPCAPADAYPCNVAGFGEAVVLWLLPLQLALLAGAALLGLSALARGARESGHAGRLAALGALSAALGGALAAQRLALWDHIRSINPDIGFVLSGAAAWRPAAFGAVALAALALLALWRRAAPAPAHLRGDRLAARLLLGLALGGAALIAGLVRGYALWMG